MNYLYIILATRKIITICTIRRFPCNGGNNFFYNFKILFFIIIFISLAQQGQLRCTCALATRVNVSVDSQTRRPTFDGDGDSWPAAVAGRGSQNNNSVGSTVEKVTRKQKSAGRGARRVVMGDERSERTTISLRARDRGV